MTIAIVGSYPVSPNCICGGVESSVYGLATALCPHHIVDVFDVPRLGGTDSGERFENLTIHRYKNQGSYNQDALQRADEVLRDIVAIHPDIVHVHGTGEYSAYIYRSIKEYGIKTMLTVHGLLHVEKKNLLKKKPSLKHLYQYLHQSRIEFDILNYADQIIVDTEYVSKQIFEYHKRGKIKNLPSISVIPQGINETYLQIEPENNANIILSVGSISRRKGHLYLLKAFEKVCLQDPSAKLVIAGTLADKEYYAQLKEYIGSLPIKNNIQLLTNLSQEQLLSLYKKASVFALHSQEESQGIALVEAMAAYLPIVSTMVGGIPYVVNHGTTGLLSKYGDITNFAQSIISLLSNNDFRQQLSEAAHEEAKRYTWQGIAKTIETIYSSRM